MFVSMVCASLRRRLCIARACVFMVQVDLSCMRVCQNVDLIVLFVRRRGKCVCVYGTSHLVQGVRVFLICVYGVRL